jgi:hypothetical protein
VKDLSDDNHNFCSLRYGSVETGSLIELHYGAVARVEVGAVTFSEYVYDWPGIGDS